METDRVCAKCNSGAVSVIRLDWPRIGGTIATGVFTDAKVDHHVCTSCGYVETYISDQETRARIARKFPAG